MHSRKSGIRAAALVTLASLGTALAAGPEPAEDPCNFHASMPLLQRDAYKTYTYTERENDAATESARLAADVRIEIVSSGCVDSSARTYTLTYSGAALPKRSLAQWAVVAQREMGALRYADEAKDAARDIAAFAGQIAATPSTGDKAVRCADDSVPPDGECAWSTGGSRSIEVRREPHSVQVILTESSSR